MISTVATDWQTSYSARTHDAAEALVPATSLRIATQPVGFHLGTGTTVFNHLVPLLLKHTERELLLVTCFWASSPSLGTLNVLLRNLSAKARDIGHKIRVRICFSSRSLLQKLFHTRSPEGHVYPPSSWQATLGLPPPAELTGLELQIKSIFITPFSVMHPKFIIADRAQVFLPSCNVSWEDWLEGATHLQVTHNNPVVELWRNFWGGRGGFQVPETLEELNSSLLQAAKSSRAGSIAHCTDSNPRDDGGLDPSLGQLPGGVQFSGSETDILFLPHPHHAWPRFRPWPLSPCPAPKTPLNDFTLTLLEHAEHGIWMITPNLTSSPVIKAIKDALRRGVAVHIVTNLDLMVAEQLLTSFTTTARCMRKLRAWYDSARWRQVARGDLERGNSIGTLEIDWYTPLTEDLRSERQTRKSRQGGSPDLRETATPVKTHIKLTVVDDAVMLLGSGNQDRASWYTSQELGFAVSHREVIASTKQLVQQALRDRTQRYPD